MAKPNEFYEWLNAVTSKPISQYSQDEIKLFSNWYDHLKNEAAGMKNPCPHWRKRKKNGSMVVFLDHPKEECEGM